MPDAPVVTVVAATHDRGDRLGALLDGLLAQTLPADRFEVVIVDDGSSDHTPEVLAAARANGRLNLRCERHAEPRGPAAARNLGWRSARAPLVAFTDDDCVPTPRWLEALLALAGGRTDLIVQGTTLPDPREADRLGPYAKTVRIEGQSPHFETCNILYPRALLEELGGFDESYPAPAGEDTDLGWRARAAGAGAAFAPEAVVHHAVHEGTPLSALRGALMAQHGVQSYRNPELRATLPQGVFYDRSHPLLLQAAYAGLLARRQPAAALLCLPYLLNVRSRCRASGGRLAQAPFFVLYDVVQVGATIRGALRHRVPVI